MIGQTNKAIQLAKAYCNAKKLVISNGFYDEIIWQTGVSFDSLSETDFLREMAWVILSSGMRESVVRSKFPSISKAFLDWESSHVIIAHKSKCQVDAQLIFNNINKIKAILSIVQTVERDSFTVVKDMISSEGIGYIKELPYMGPATSYHLAKNIGLNVVKPDRHLLRLTEATGYESPYDLCEEIAQQTGDKISVVDIVLWRFATMHSHYTDYFTTYLSI